MDMYQAQSLHEAAQSYERTARNPQWSQEARDWAAKGAALIREDLRNGIAPERTE